MDGEDDGWTETETHLQGRNERGAQVREFPITVVVAMAPEYGPAPTVTGVVVQRWTRDGLNGTAINVHFDPATLRAFPPGQRASFDITCWTTVVATGRDGRPFEGDVGASDGWNSVEVAGIESVVDVVSESASYDTIQRMSVQVTINDPV